ncbi:uncharacterized protein BP01DRAFT_293186 [Aspergillus saccharolyticus JOP 1030-1]|uniref:Uncharacterized protein n=1 Tax=Aspergillus saccharolyticus JOP 1030-1 TaxID=1450539 RepID=A0A318ZGT3_9EURO|nr:hypothetical protein BP01DRAFT_293186 [Aspergillus saccharolyticus JOP 1030-1]PYH46761.1 hypothetical protein BP01DRAFT_293186 [Aspergillus saccharolyticus JOP 1030-1]
MSSQNMNKKSWESLSSTFSQLEISISHDSCYASDEFSDPPKPTTVSTTLDASSLVPAVATPLQSTLKPILKRSYSEVEDDEERESGYASAESDYEYDSFDESDDDMCEISEWDEASDIMSQSDGDNDDVASLDGSFIIEFGSHVQFDANICYIEAPELEDDDESPEAGLTCHELFELARASGSLRLQEGEGPGDQLNECEDEDSMILEALKQLPEEHPDDVVDLDKSLFVAYMNGINGLNDPQYKSRLRHRVDEIKSGRAHTPYLDEDGTTGTCIDNALNHVIGVFHNIVAEEEFNELVDLSHVKGSCTGPSGCINQKLLCKLENILSERLVSDAVRIGPDELSFFTTGLAYALDHWNGYMTG